MPAPASDAGVPGPTRGVVTIWPEGADTFAQAGFSQLIRASCACREAQVDGCLLISCVTGTRSPCAGQVSTSRALSAGTVTITRPSGPPLVLPPGSSPVRGPGGPGPAGASITVEASGDEVPAFRTATLIPEPLQLTEGPIFVRGQPLRVRWVPEGSGVVEARMDWFWIPDGEGSRNTFICTAPARAGELILPQDAFGAPEQLQIRRLNRTSVTAGTVDVDIEVVSTQLRRSGRELVPPDAGAAADARPGQ